MEKKTYSKPVMVAELFEPQNYIAACMDQVSTLPPGDYRIGWCIRDATGSNLERAYAGTNQDKEGWFLAAPEGFTAGQNIEDIIDTSKSQPGSWVETYYSGYEWYDLNYSGATGRLTKGDKIRFNGAEFTLDGNSYTALAVPASAIFSVTNHS